MAKKEGFHAGVSIIPNLGEKQGSWYYPLKFLFTTLCAAIIIFAIGSVIDLLVITGGWKGLLIMLIVIIGALYIVAAIKIFIDWCRNTKAITEQEIAKSKILFLEAYKRAKELKPGAVLYDETEWVHDIVKNLKNKPEGTRAKKK